MVYYNMDNYDIIGFKESNRKRNKYICILKNKETDALVNIHFGDPLKENYYDQTGLGIYSHLDHRDTEKLEKYLKRMYHFTKDGYFSPAYLNYRFL